MKCNSRYASFSHSSAMWRAGGAFVGTAIFSLTLTARVGGAAMLRSARSRLRAAVVARVYERADVCPLYTSVPLQYTLNKISSLLLTPRLISISSSFPGTETWGQDPHIGDPDIKSPRRCDRCGPVAARLCRHRRCLCGTPSSSTRTRTFESRNRLHRQLAVLAFASVCRVTSCACWLAGTHA